MLKLTAETYFSPRANREYMSVSQFKSFEKCESSALAEIKGKYVRPETTALLVGGYVDAYFSDELDGFVASHPEIFRADGKLKSDYLQAQQIIEVIERDRMMMRYLSGDRQTILTGMIEGVPVKCKVDVLRKDRIVDLKIMRDFEPVWTDEYGKVPFFEAWEYDLQGAVYQEIVRQNTGKTLPFYIVAATKEAVPDHDIIHIPQTMLDASLEKFKNSVASYDAIKKGILKPGRCEECDYCKVSKRIHEPTEASEYYF